MVVVGAHLRPAWEGTKLSSQYYNIAPVSTVLDLVMVAMWLCLFQD